MTEADLLKIIVRQLKLLDIPYYVTGSFATFHYGEPRATRDVDIVIVLPHEKVMGLVRAFDTPEYYLSKEAAMHAIQHRMMFNLLHVDSALKVDLIIDKGTAFSQSCWKRLRKMMIGYDFEADFISPEDVIINKLLFYQEGGSEKHLRDIAGVIRISRTSLDIGYIQRWAATLGVSDEWRNVYEAAVADL